MAETIKIKIGEQETEVKLKQKGTFEGAEVDLTLTGVNIQPIHGTRMSLVEYDYDVEPTKPKDKKEK